MIKDLYYISMLLAVFMWVGDYMIISGIFFIIALISIFFNVKKKDTKGGKSK